MNFTFEQWLGFGLIWLGLAALVGPVVGKWIKHGHSQD